jgi:hypothetical protein
MRFSETYKKVTPMLLMCVYIHKTQHVIELFDILTGQQ